MGARDHQVLTSEDRVQLTPVLRVLWRYKFLIAAVTLIFSGAGVALAYSITPLYYAETSISEATSDNLSNTAAQLTSQLGGIASLAGVNLGGSGSKSSEYLGVLKSRKLVEEFITQNRLMPALFPKATDKATLWFGVRKFQSSILSIRDDKRNNLTIVGVTWTDPVSAAKWANQFVALANDILRDDAMKEATASISYLNQQIAHTSVIEIQRVMYGLVENETKTLMLANARQEYAFVVVDPAVPPELKSSPRRTIIVLLAAATGMVSSAVIAFLLAGWSGKTDNRL